MRFPYVAVLLLFFVATSTSELRRAKGKIFLSGGFDASLFVDEKEVDDKVQILCRKSAQLEGLYLKTAWDINGRPHYERDTMNDPKGPKLHIYWSRNQWIINYDLDPARNFDNLLAYAKVKADDPTKANSF